MAAGIFGGEAAGAEAHQKDQWKESATRDTANRSKDSHGEDRRAGDTRWLNLYDQMVRLIDLLGYTDAINISRLFVKKMQECGNHEGIRQLMSSQNARGNDANSKELIAEVNKCVLSNV